MEHSESISELAKALAAAQGEIQPVPKTKTNPYFNSTYADLADVVQAVAPILSKHGLAVTQWPEVDGGRPVLVTMLCHASGEWLCSAMPLFVAKQDSLSLGSAITYGRRFALSAAVNVAADEDDDGNRASRGPKEAPVPTAVEGPAGAEDDGEDQRARNLRLLAEHRGRHPQVEHAQGVAEKLATRARPSPRRPMP